MKRRWKTGNRPKWRKDEVIEPSIEPLFEDLDPADMIDRLSKQMNENIDEIFRICM